MGLKRLRGGGKMSTAGWPEYSFVHTEDVQHGIFRHVWVYRPVGELNKFAIALRYRIPVKGYQDAWKAPLHKVFDVFTPEAIGFRTATGVREYLETWRRAKLELSHRIDAWLEEVGWATVETLGPNEQHVWSEETLTARAAQAQTAVDENELWPVQLMLCLRTACRPPAQGEAESTPAPDEAAVRLATEAASSASISELAEISESASDTEAVVAASIVRDEQTVPAVAVFELESGIAEESTSSSAATPEAEAPSLKAAMQRYEQTLRRMRSDAAALAKHFEAEATVSSVEAMDRLQRSHAEWLEETKQFESALKSEYHALGGEIVALAAPIDGERLQEALESVLRSLDAGAGTRTRAVRRLAELRHEVTSYTQQRSESLRRREALLAEWAAIRAEGARFGYVVDAVPSAETDSIASLQQLNESCLVMRDVVQSLEEGLQRHVAAAIAVRARDGAKLLEQLGAAKAQGVTQAAALVRRMQAAVDALRSAVRRDEQKNALRVLDDVQSDATALLEELGVERMAQRLMREPDWDAALALVGSLWLRQDYARAFVVLTAALRAGYGPTDDLRTVNVLQGCLRDAAAFLKQDSTLLVRQMLLDSYWQSLTPKLSVADNAVFALLIAAHAIAGDPRCGAAEVWQPLAGAESLMRERTPRWFKLADHILNEAEWKLAQHAVDYQDRRRELENAMRAEFARRQDGRYARVSADGISAMLQIEQQKLLPDLEKRTEALIVAVPGTDAWLRLTQELSASAESVFDRYFGGLDESRHPHMRRNLLHRLNGMRDVWRDYAGLRSEQHEQEDHRPFVVSELHAEIEGVADLLGGTMKKIVHDLLDRAAAGTPFVEPTAESFVESDFFGTWMKSLLLSRSDVVRMFPTTAEYVFVTQNKSAVTWDRLLTHAAEDLHQSISSAELLRRFAESGFFFGAEAVARESDAVALQALLAERDALDAQIDQMMKRLREPDAVLLEWRRTGRLRALAARLQQELVVQDEIERQQDEEKRRRVGSLLKKLKNDVRDLEDQLSELSMQSELSQQTIDELTRGLDEARSVALRRIERGIDTASNIVEEIIHFIAYEGSALADVTRAIDRHRDEISQAERAETEDRAVLAIRVPIESAAWIDELRKDGLSDSQIAVRKDVWECWQRMRSMQSRLDDGGVVGEEAETLQAFARKYAEVTRLMYGRTSETLFSAKPLAFFETRFQQPRDALRRYRVRFLFVTGAVTKRDLRILEDHLRTSNLLEDGWLNVFVAPRDDAAAVLSAWIDRTHMLATSSVLDGRTLQTILACRHNPTAAGRMCRLLLQSVDPMHIGVFRFQNVVDSEKDIFKGRSNEIKQIETGRGSYFVYGGRRIGKTSLLFAAENHLKKAGASTAYVSFEGHSDPQGLTVCRDVLRKLGVPHRCDSLDDFRTLFTDFAHRVAAEKPDKLERREVVVFLDEVDRYITGCREAGQRSHTLIHVLRSLHQELHGKARFVMAGAIELWRQLNGRSDIPGAETPWANFGERIALGALNAADARAIAATGFGEVLGIGVAEGVDRQIVENTTGHPAFVQFYCDKLHKRLHQRGGDVLIMEDVVQVFKDRRSDSFVTYARDTLSLNLGDLTRLSVYLLAIERCDRFGPSDLARLAPGYQVPAEMPWQQCLDELEMTGVIRAEGGVHRFSVPTYPELLRQMEQSLQDDLAQLIEKIGAAHDAANGGER
jgi:hypothetical protein